MGEYDPANETISVIGRNEEEARSILLHEVMHAVQTREDFAQGGNPSMGEDYEGLEGEVEAAEASAKKMTAEWEAKAAKGDYDSVLGRDQHSRERWCARRGTNTTSASLARLRRVMFRRAMPNPQKAEVNRRPTVAARAPS